MKKVENKRYHETYYEETLENGLRVVLWEKKDYEKSLFMIATPLGGMDLLQTDETGKEYQFPAGIAHFLEHKMFEMEDYDVMDRFSALGANVNAFTGYTETAYYFSTTENVYPPLELLLNFVQELHISEESVEKEKGIIIQELNMYKQMSDNRLLMEIYASLYDQHPLRYDIGGDDDSVNSITLQQLEECYHLNYHPSKMILIGVSGENPDKLMKFIKENQNQKTFENVKHVKRIEFCENEEPARKFYQFHMDVSIPKVAIAYKLHGIKDIVERTKMEWCIKVMLSAQFSSLFPDFQKWIDEGIFNDYVGCEVDLGEDYGMIMFYAETTKKEEFKKIVKETMERVKKGNIDEHVLEQLKRRFFGVSIRSMNSFDEIAISNVRAYFDDIDYFQSLDFIYEISLEDVKSVCTSLDTSQSCEIELLPEKEK